MAELDGAPVVVWLTGLSAAGKTTLGRSVVAALQEGSSWPVEHLDGDEVRNAVGAPGFGRAARDLNVALVGYAASLLQRHGVNVVVSLISPYDRARKLVRSLCDPFVLVHVSTALEVCAARDPKGLYAMARFGLIPNFTGVTDPYEAPRDATVTVDTAVTSVAAGTEAIVRAAQTASSARAQR